MYQRGCVGCRPKRCIEGQTDESWVRLALDEFRITLAGCRMVVRERRSENTVPRQKLPPGELGNGTSSVDARVGPIAAADSEQLEEGSKQAW